MVEYLIIIILSFLLTFALAIPFIDLLYKFNIRRISKTDLDRVLPGRKIKLGQPVMGGAIIIISVVFLSSFLLKDWEYYPMIVLLSVAGAIVGGIDEYVNTLGRTIRAVRISKSTKMKTISFFPSTGILGYMKRGLLVPWKAFEEIVRVTGSEQRGMKNHYKLLLQIGVALIPAFYLYNSDFVPAIYLPYFGSISVGFIYFPFLLIVLLFFGNAFGITDGMDGLSAGSHAISFLAYGILATYLDIPNVAILAFIIVGAELAFLYFNINPARVEMSDVGTLPLGMLFVMIAILSYREVALPFIGGLFTIEILSSVAQQWSVKLRGKRIFLVAPIHHHYEKLGWSETKVVERLWLFTVLSSIVGLILALV